MKIEKNKKHKEISQNEKESVIEKEKKKKSRKQKREGKRNDTKNIKIQKIKHTSIDNKEETN